MRAEILAVGSELLDAAALRHQRRSTSRRSCARSASRWWRGSPWPTTGASLESAFRAALARAGRRDLHRAASGPPRTTSPARPPPRPWAARSAATQGILEALRARFARFGRVMAPVNEKQADVIEGRVGPAQPARHGARAVARGRRAGAVPAAGPARPR